MKKDVSKAQFWNDCYINHDIGWDLGDITPVFQDWANSLTKKSSILVPGSGNSYDALYFASLGHNVLAVDFSKEVINRVRDRASKDNIEINLLNCDFFDLDSTYYNSFDYIIEYTFFCAINPKNRLNYIEMVHSLLKTSGKLVGLFLPLNKKKMDGGPPFGVSLKEIEDNFCKKFKLIKTFKHPLSIKARFENEQYFEFQKLRLI